MAGTQQTLWRRGYMTDTRLSLAAAASVWRSSTKEQLRSNRILIKHSYVLGKQRERQRGERGERERGERGGGPVRVARFIARNICIRPINIH